MRINKKILFVSLLLAGAATLFIFSTSHHTIDFNTQVKPIFNKKCISCHGGVKRQAGFSLLFRSEALEKAESGKFAIIPGDPDNSEMIRRIRLDDPEERMPYQHPPLSPQEINVLHDWVKEGAVWGDHWAYVPVRKPEVPAAGAGFLGLFAGDKTDWMRNDIDRFVAARWEAHGLTRSPKAAPEVLARRLAFDITGLPCPPELAKRFLENPDETGYRQLLDSMLASNAYGERWASTWLDLARYADTKGYERDDNRNIWHYRDWLIDAFNSDKRYDRFLTEQIAGDLLPNADDATLIATAFHRNTMTNDEGGTENEEFRTAAVLDRVNTTWEALMGTTFSCVQCHSHPYDPFSHDEYYKFMAFFNDTRDEDAYAEYPLLRHFTKADSATLLHIRDWLATNGFRNESAEVVKFLKTWQPSINSLMADQFLNSELNDTKWLVLRNNARARLKTVTLTGKDRLIFRYNGYLPGGDWQIHLDRPDGPLLARVLLKETKGWNFAETAIARVDGVHDLFFTYTNPNFTKPDQNGVQFDWFYFTGNLPGKGLMGYDSVRRAFDTLLRKDMPTTPIMMENPTDMFRSSQVFERGNWLVKGETVQPGVPHALTPMPKNAPRNRLGLAQWMTSKQNPLTARTMVNRVWEQLFGTGLVETLEDMGTQGAAPTHPELLDYLAYRYMNDMQWSTKTLIREIVSSAIYQQASQASKDAIEKDPSNKYYARGARVRLSAEQLRDQALAVSGLLSAKMYGPPVMPWQPQGIWLSPYNGRSWKQSSGEDQYRRAVYTFVKRTAPYPSMISFDGVSREFCAVRRIRTNTPLQALVTMNDSVYLEAARHLAWKMQSQAPNREPLATISYGYQQALGMPGEPAKIVALRRLYDKALSTLQRDPAKTCEIAGKMDDHNNPKSAALVVVAQAILNLDEFVTRN